MQSENQFRAPQSDPLDPPARRLSSSAQDIVSKDMLSNLKATRPWLITIAILVMFFSLTSFVVGLAILILGDMFSEADPVMSTLPFRLGISGLYILVSIIFAMPVFFAFQISAGIKEVGRGDTAKGLAKYIKNNKSFFKFWGILSICYILLILLAIAASIALPFYAAARG